MEWSRPSPPPGRRNVRSVLSGSDVFIGFEGRRAVARLLASGVRVYGGARNSSSDRNPVRAARRREAWKTNREELTMIRLARIGVLAWVLAAAGISTAAAADETFNFDKH